MFLQTSRLLHRHCIRQGNQCPPPQAIMVLFVVTCLDIVRSDKKANCKMHMTLNKISIMLRPAAWAFASGKEITHIQRFFTQYFLSISTWTYNLRNSCVI